MGLILKNKSVFLHIPKTGGNFVVSVLQRYKLIAKEFPLHEKHCDFNRLPFVDKRTWKKKPFYFCFVRHPVDWYESWYKYQFNPIIQWREWHTTHKAHPCAMIDGCKSETFNEFIEKILKKHPGFVTELYSQFTKGCRFVGKQETLMQDLSFLLDKWKVNYNKDVLFSLEKVNVSPEKHIYWHQDLYDEVWKCEYATIKRYGYKDEKSIKCRV